MLIWLVDRQRYFKVTFEEMLNICKSGLTAAEFTLSNIQPYLLY